MGYARCSVESNTKHMERGTKQIKSQGVMISIIIHQEMQRRLLVQEYMQMLYIAIIVLCVSEMILHEGESS